MKIKKISIKNFGPLSEINYEPEKINLLYGNNETGKTAFVDSFILSLFKTRRTVFPGSDRFNFESDISIVLESKGKEYTFPSKKQSLENLIELSDIELSRLFIVRAGELNLKSSDRWWPALRRFLTGMNADLDKIKDDVYSKTGITKKGKWVSKKSEDKQKQIEKLENRLKKLEQARDELVLVSKKEKNIEELHNNLKSKNEKLENLIHIKNFNFYKQTTQLYQDYVITKEKLINLERYKIEYDKKWQSLILEIKEKKDRLDILTEYLDKIKEKKNKLDINIDSKKSNLEKYSEIENIKKLYGVNNKIGEFYLNHFFNRYFKTFLIFFACILVSSIFFGISWLTDKIIFSVIGIFNLSLGIMFLLSNIIINRKFLKINLEKKINTCDISGKEINAFKKLYNNKENIIEQKSTLKLEEQEKKRCLEEIEDLRLKIKDLQNQIKIIDKKIENFRKITGLAELKDLQIKLQEKTSLEKKMNELYTKLEIKLSEPVEENWPRKLKSIEISTPDFTLEYLPDEENLLKTEIDEIKKQIEKETRDVESFKNKLKDILEIEDIPSLWLEISNLKNKLYKENLNRESALLVGSIIDNMTSDFDYSLKNLLKKGDNTVSYYFNKITSGRYKEVEFKEDDFCVKDENGRIFSFNDLSTGTQDQLMLSLRLGIIMKGFQEPGFILLDDTFLTSDYIRRKNLVSLIKYLADQDWQVFYFTVDDYIKNLFIDICKAKVISLNMVNVKKDSGL